MITKVKIKKLNPKAQVPFWGSRQAAGADLKACLPDPFVDINPGETKLIPLGFSAEFPNGHAALILARSGLSLKKGLAPINAPGVVDPDYRGEWVVLLHNYSNERQIIEDGERIAQVMFVEVDQPEFIELEEGEDFDEPDTERNTGGLGSTGKF